SGLSQVENIRYSQNDQLVSLIFKSGHAQIRDANSGILLSSLDEKIFPIYEVCFASDNNWAIAISSNSILKLNLTNFKGEIMVAEGLSNSAERYLDHTFSPNGNAVVIATNTQDRFFYFRYWLFNPVAKGYDFRAVELTFPARFIKTISPSYGQAQAPRCA